MPDLKPVIHAHNVHVNTGSYMNKCFFQVFFSAVTESRFYFFCLQIFNPGCNTSTQEDIIREDQVL